MAPDADHGYETELAAAVNAAVAAGREIKARYDRADAAVKTKGDGSPVTDADLASDQIIRELLSDRFPQDPILTEEGVDDPERLASRRCWVVDPLDGTAQFVARTGEFDVLIALVEDGRPIVGVTYQPVSDLLCTAIIGHGAWVETSGERRPLRFEPVPASRPPRLATSIWFGAPRTLPRLARVAARVGAFPPETAPTGFQPRLLLPDVRRFDAYLGLVTTPDEPMAGEWDLAACDLIAAEAGGVFTDAWGRPHRYNKPSVRNYGGLLVAADPVTHGRLVEALRPELPDG